MTESEEIEELKERVNELEDQVGYLESELEISVEKQRFRNIVKQALRNSESIEIDTDDAFQWTAKAEIKPEYVRHAVENVNAKFAYEWQLESSDGEKAVVVITKDTRK